MTLRLLHFVLVSLSVVYDVLAQDVAEQAKPTKYIQIPGAKLEYVVEGKGKPCLVLGSHLFSPRTFSADLRNQLQFYFVDMRWVAKEYDFVDLEEVTLSSIVEDVENMRTQLSLDKVILIGQGLNGLIAFEYVKKYPDRVSHLVMIGVAPLRKTQEYQSYVNENWKTASKERVDLNKEKWQKYLDADGLSAEQTFVAIYDAMSPVYWYDPAYDATWLWKDVNIHTSLVGHVSNTIFLDHKMFRDGKWLPVPTFVALGKYDFLTPSTLWKDYEAIPGLKLSIFEKSGIMPNLEESERFDTQLVNWITRN